METEIELKLVVPENARLLIEQQLLPSLSGQHRVTENQLSNFYYDTADLRLQQQRVGFRVRGQNGSYEQTVKTAGTVVGGLHQRPEFNVPLPNSQPDLSLFDAAIWPSPIQAETLQDELELVFTTHFNRVAYHVQIEGSEIEMALDQGLIEAGHQQQVINEVELELKQGRVEGLFELAAKLQALMPVRFSNLSKAARGYSLAGNTLLQTKAMVEFLPLQHGDDSETAFCKVLETALVHWQHHQDVYLQSQTDKALAQMLRGMRLLLQAVALYLPILPCPQLVQFHQQLLVLLPQWDWLDDFNALLALRSKKGPFSKRLQKHPELLGYLHGRCVGMLQQQSPKDLLLAPVYADVQLQAVKLLHQRPWRDHGENYHQPVVDHVKGWLSQGWQAVMQIMPPGETLSCEHYVSIELILRHTLTNGFMLGALFEQRRDQFRAPWLDVLCGIEELKALLLLQHALKQAEIEQSAELLEWSEQKMQNLLTVMEQSRQVGLQTEAYW